MRASHRGVHEQHVTFVTLALQEPITEIISAKVLPMIVAKMDVLHERVTLRQVGVGLHSTLHFVYLVTPERVLIGLSARTNGEGAAALQTLLHSIGLASEVVGVPAGTLHLKSDCSLVDEDTVLATRELAASGLLAGFRVLVVPEEERAAANSVRINDVVLVREDCPRTTEMLEKLAASVVPLPVSEIAKIDAGLSCMSLRWFDREAGPR